MDLPSAAASAPRPPGDNMDRFHLEHAPARRSGGPIQRAFTRTRRRGSRGSGLARPFRFLGENPSHASAGQPLSLEAWATALTVAAEYSGPTRSARQRTRHCVHNPEDGGAEGCWGGGEGTSRSAGWIAEGLSSAPRMNLPARTRSRRFSERAQTL